MNNKILANKLNFSHSQISEWTSKGRRIPYDKLKMISEYFGLDQSFLIKQLSHKEVKTIKNVAEYLDEYKTLGIVFKNVEEIEIFLDKRKETLNSAESFFNVLKHLDYEQREEVINLNNSLISLVKNYKNEDIVIINKIIKLLISNNVDKDHLSQMLEIYQLAANDKKQ